MTESLVNTKFAQLAPEIDPIERVKVLSMLLTRAADGFEVGELKPGDPEFKNTVNNLFKHEPLKEGEPKPEDWDLKTLISKTWEKANVYLLSVGEQDINQGFEFGVALATLPE